MAFSLYQQDLREKGVKNEQIISINLEDLAYEHLLDYKSLHDYIQNLLIPDKMNYIFVDEVQKCPHFEKSADSLHIKPNTDLYITGSNAYMLSGELATLLSGRYVEISMLPLSFAEYHNGTMDSTLNVQEKFKKYLKFGSFPHLADHSFSETAIMEYLEGIQNSIIVKDIATREKNTDTSLLLRVMKTLMSNTGSPVSVKKISDTIMSSGRKTTVDTVDHYLKALTDAYIFYKVERFDIKGKDFLKTNGKYYCVDTGLRSLAIHRQDSDIGHLIENLVYLELIRRGYKVSIGKTGEKEVNFVAKKMDELLYFQVSASVLDQGTKERELAPFEKIKDHFPKILLTLDEFGNGTLENGVIQRNLIQWLLGQHLTPPPSQLSEKSVPQIR